MEEKSARREIVRTQVREMLEGSAAYRKLPEAARRRIAARLPERPPASRDSSSRPRPRSSKVNLSQDQVLVTGATG